MTKGKTKEENQLCPWQDLNLEASAEGPSIRAGREPHSNRPPYRSPPYLARCIAKSPSGGLRTRGQRSHDDDRICSLKNLTRRARPLRDSGVGPGEVLKGPRGYSRRRHRMLDTGTSVAAICALELGSLPPLDHVAIRRHIECEMCVTVAAIYDHVLGI